jgi:arylsulfatase
VYPSRRLALTLLAAVGLAACQCGYRSDPPRIVLVTIDTLRADHLGSYGYRRPTSPFLDRLAAEGTLFLRAMSSASHTAPSHATLMTGRYMHEHGVVKNGNRIAAGLPTLALQLREAGYQTAAFVSTKFLRRLDRSFETVDGGHRAAERTLAAAERWMHEATPPFFVWIHLFDIHGWKSDKPISAEAIDRVREAGPQGKELYDYVRDLHGLGQRGADLAGSRQRFAGNRKQVIEGVDRYDAQTRVVDDALARFFASVGGSGEGWLWVVTGDHGEGVGSHDYLGHGRYVYEEQIRVPLIFWAPGGSLSNPPVDVMVHHVDVMPTLLELAGLPTPRDAGARGASLVPLLEGGALGEGRILLAQRRANFGDRNWADEVVFVLRDGRYKYIYHSKNEDEFFDLASDPTESRRLPVDGDPEGERLREMARALAPDLTIRRARDVPEELLPELRALGYVDEPSP